MKSERKEIKRINRYNYQEYHFYDIHVGKITEAALIDKDTAIVTRAKKRSQQDYKKINQKRWLQTFVSSYKQNHTNPALQHKQKLFFLPSSFYFKTHFLSYLFLIQKQKYFFLFSYSKGEDKNATPLSVLKQPRPQYILHLYHWYHKHGIQFKRSKSPTLLLFLFPISFLF